MNYKNQCNTSMTSKELEAVVDAFKKMRKAIVDAIDDQRDELMEIIRNDNK